jgi:hypothetical protein
LKAFETVLKYAQLSIILGPPNVGKSNLMSKVIMDGSHDVAALDLRTVGFTSPIDFHLELQTQFSSSFFDSLKAAASALSIDLGGAIGMPDMIKLEYNDKVEDYRVGHFIRHLDRIAAVIPPITVWNGKRSPVLFIDEANKLQNLIKSPGDEGDTVVQTLLDWMVKNTKQDPRLHVVLASSDSFFLEWLNERNIARHARVYTVGDLSYEEAERFYRLEISKNLDKSLQKRILPFEAVYPVLGGRMYHIDQYVRDFCIKEGKLSWSSFAPLRSSLARMQGSLRPGSFQTLLSSCEWSQEDVLKVMKIMTMDEKKPFIEYSEFVNLVGDKACKSLIKHNVFIYRHNLDFAFDIPGAPDDPIVTAASPMEHYAMKLLLQAL